MFSIPMQTKMRQIHPILERGSGNGREASRIRRKDTRTALIERQAMQREQRPPVTTRGDDAAHVSPCQSTQSRKQHT